MVVVVLANGVILAGVILGVVIALTVPTAKVDGIVSLVVEIPVAGPGDDSDVGKLGGVIAGVVTTVDFGGKTFCVDSLTVVEAP